MRLKWLIPLLIALAGVALAACGGGSDQTAETSPLAATGGPSPTSSGQAVGAGVSDLAKAVVQIFALDANGDPVWSGSGTVISPDGLILTNGHVVDDRKHEYDHLGVATTSRTDEPAHLGYLAEIAAVDYALDLAVIEITSDIDGKRVNERFPFVVLGDSAKVEIGDKLRILGYPGIGGETITLTDGVISGFTAERSVGARAWIKTDATIAGGNSGGLAVNDNGKLIGVPTIAGSGAASRDTVDCRQIVDTNRDGIIDGLDTCVPVGGFINGLRPVNLALELIDAAGRGATYVSKFEPEPEPSAGFDTRDVSLSKMVFADGVTADDRPANELDAFPSGVARVCGFWDYEGMVDGMSWEGLWFVDGQLNEQGSIVGDTWVGGAAGSWWVCIVDEQNGLADGLYELSISVEGEARGSSAVFVGGSHPPVTLTLENSASKTVCYVFLSPAGAQNWGFDRLGIGQGIEVGATHTLRLAAGVYDLLAQDCNRKDVVDERDLDITRDTTYTVTG